MGKRISPIIEKKITELYQKGMKPRQIVRELASYGIEINVNSIASVRRRAGVGPKYRAVTPRKEYETPTIEEFTVVAYPEAPDTESIIEGIKESDGFVIIPKSQITQAKAMLQSIINSLEGLETEETET